MHLIRRIQPLSGEWENIRWFAIFPDSPKHFSRHKEELPWEIKEISENIVKLAIHYFNISNISF